MPRKVVLVCVIFVAVFVIIGSAMAIKGLSRNDDTSIDKVGPGVEETFVDYAEMELLNTLLSELSNNGGAITTVYNGGYHEVTIEIGTGFTIYGDMIFAKVSGFNLYYVFDIHTIVRIDIH